VFFPKPNVDSALLTLDFTKPHPDLYRVDGDHLRRVVTAAFRQRRKMMRQSLKELLQAEGLVLPEKWATLRPEQLTPPQFIDLTADLFGEAAGGRWREAASASASGAAAGAVGERVADESRPIWRKALYPNAGGSAADADEEE